MIYRQDNIIFSKINIVLRLYNGFIQVYRFEYILTRFGDEY